MRKHVLVGAGAGILLFLMYLGVTTLAQGFGQTLKQAATIWYWLLILTTGFGVQAGLFSFVRQSLKERRTAATASVAASGSVSAGSMIACCAHRIVDVMPFLGLSGLAAFLSGYQVVFLAIGALSNLVGITVMLETIQRHGLSSRVVGWWDMGRVKKGTMVSAGLIIGIIVFRTLSVS
ncbi:MAG: hypothetical protein HYX80_09990 [Chloroflexi bacterium]|nr:hypothetical protein [Chloroflexota bacterium]